jgi:hypothetical protein
MNASTAAAKAGVTVATIRHWCRAGVVAARKTAGAWIIESRSLAHRIALGKKPVPAPLVITTAAPAIADIVTAAHAYEQARLDTNAAARIKRTAEKVLKRTPDGVYGPVTVERFESSRQVADLDAIQALLDLHGLGEMPMKTCAPSLTLTFAAEAAGTPAADQLSTRRAA